MSAIPPPTLSTAAAHAPRVSPMQWRNCPAPTNTIVPITVNVTRTGNTLYAQYYSSHPYVCWHGCSINGHNVDAVIDSGYGNRDPYTVVFQLAGPAAADLSFPPSLGGAVLVRPDINNYDPDNLLETSCSSSYSEVNTQGWQICSPKITGKSVQFTYNNHTSFGSVNYPYHHFRLQVYDLKNSRFSCLVSDPVSKNRDGEGFNLFELALRYIKISVSWIGMALISIIHIFSKIL